MVDVGSAVGYLLLDLTGWNKGISAAKTAFNTFLDETTTGIDKAGALGSALSGIGMGLTTTVTAPLVGLGTAAVKTAGDFQQAMAQVAAVSGLDTASKEFDALSDKAKEMGATTKFSASEAAEAFNYMAMAGWDAQQMMDGISGVMDLAAASGEDLATVSDIVTDALTGFGLQAKDSAHFADVLAAASNSANTNVSMLGESFKYVAPVAGALGFSVEDVSVALGLMANSGIKASQAGTSLRSLFTNLVHPTGQAADAVEALGINVTNVDGTMKSLDQIMNELRQTFGSLTDAEKAEYAAMLAGQEGMSGLLAIVNATDADFQKLTSSINEAGGTAEEMADKQLDTLEGKLTMFKSAMEGLAISFGEVLLPAITGVIEKVTAVVTWFNELDDGTKKMIVTIAGIVAAIGPIMTIVGNLLVTFTRLHTMFTTVAGGVAKVQGALAAAGTSFGAVVAPIAAVVAVVVALVAAFKHLWDTNEEFRNNIIATWERIKSAFEKFSQDIVDRINSLGFEFESLGEVLSTVWDNITKVLGPIFEGIFTNLAIVFEGALNMILNVFDVFKGLFTGDWETFWQGITGIFSTLWETMVNVVANWGETIYNATNEILGLFGTSWEQSWTNVINWFKGAWSGALSFFVETWNSILNFFNGIVSNIVNGVFSFVSSVISFFSQLPSAIAHALGYAAGTVASWVQNLYNTVTTGLPKVIDSVVTFFAGLPGKMQQWLETALQTVVQRCSSVIDAISNWLATMWDTFVTWFTNLSDAIAQWLSEVVAAAIQWGQDMIDAAGKAMGNFINGIVKWLKGLPGQFEEWFGEVVTYLESLPDEMYEIGANILNALWNGLKSVVTGLFDWIDGVADKIKSIFSSAQQGYNNTTRAARKVSGSYATGLDYVPRTMDVRVHEGERILTKQENAEYNNGRNNSMPESIHFDLSIPLDGEVVAHRSYEYNVREGVLRGDDLVEGGATS